jgi:hypothetical protein
MEFSGHVCVMWDVDAMGMWEWWISFIGMQTSYHRDIGYTTVKNDDFGRVVFLFNQLTATSGKRGFKAYFQAKLSDVHVHSPQENVYGRLEFATKI